MGRVGREKGTRWRRLWTRGKRESFLFAEKKSRQERKGKNDVLLTLSKNYLASHFGGKNDGKKFGIDG